MADYPELVKALRLCSEDEGCFKDCPYYEKCYSPNGHIIFGVMQEAADAIEELLKVAKKMHLWIFLHSVDEQAAYDECGLTDEMNAVLGYSGQIELRVEPPKEKQT